MDKIRVLFMGTPDFAVGCLDMLLNREDIEIVGVVTQPDRQSGRGYKLLPPAVKVYALEKEIEVFQPLTVKDEAFESYIKEKNPDLIIVIAYGRIIPKFVLEYPKYGCINVHGSILPKYRGAAPIQWAVLNGEAETGVTTMMMDEGLDTGDMLVVKKLPIGEFDTSGTMFEKLAEISKDALSETIDLIKEGKLERVPQNHSEMTYAPMISKEMSYIDFNKTANEVCCHIKGMNPMPGAKITVNGKIVKILMAKVAEEANKKAGTVVECKDRLVISCLDKNIEVLKIQPEGKKQMDIEDFLKGNNIFTENMEI